MIHLSTRKSVWGSDLSINQPLTSHGWCGRYLGRVVRDLRVFRYETDAETRLVHGRRTRRVQESGASKQDRTLAAVGRHLGDGHLVGNQTLRHSVYPTATPFAVTVTATNDS